MAKKHSHDEEHHTHEHHEEHRKVSKISRTPKRSLNIWKLSSAILAILFIFSLGTKGFTSFDIFSGISLPTGAGLGADEFQLEGSFVLGDPNAPVTIIEYSDYQCPFCARFYADTLPQLKEKYLETGKAKLVYKDFPLSFHANAESAAVAARCAGDQGQYFDYHDMLFDHQDDWSGDSNPTDRFVGYAAQIGLDENEFEACLTENRHIDDVRADFQEGQQRGVTGTPAFFVNGQRIVGAQPYQVFEQAIEAALAGQEIPEDTPEPQPEPQPEPEPERIDVQADLEGWPSIGDPNAPVTIIEYSDFACPFCTRFWEQTLPSIKQDYVDEGIVRFVYKDFVVVGGDRAAEAAHCAAEQDSFWEYHDLLFEHHEQDRARWSDPNVHRGYAETLGLDADALVECFEERRYQAKVQESTREAQAHGGRGTPYFLVNDIPVSGAQPYPVFVEAIETALTGDASAPPPQPEPQPEPETASVDAVGPMLGDADAPVVIIEFSSYQCPFCKRFHEETMPSLMEEYIEAGVVRHYYRDFPLPMQANSGPAAHAARCAGEQDSYHAYQGVLFAQQEEWSPLSDPTDQFVSYAEQVGLDTNAFHECQESGRYDADVTADAQAGAAAGVSGTPSFFIGNEEDGYEMLVGAQPLPVFAEAIEAAQS